MRAYPKGRRRAEGRGKKTPAVIERITELLKHETGGDPMSHLKWTRKTTEKVAEELHKIKIQISAKTVGRLLDEMGFSLRVNHKCLESGNKNPRIWYRPSRVLTFYSRGGADEIAYN
jgi:transposase